MIKSLKHKGLQKFFETGSTAGIQSAHKQKLNALDGIRQSKLSTLMKWKNWRLPKGRPIRDKADLARPTPA